MRDRLCPGQLGELHPSASALPYPLFGEELLLCCAPELHSDTKGKKDIPSTVRQPWLAFLLW